MVKLVGPVPGIMAKRKSPYLAAGLGFSRAASER